MGTGTRREITTHIGGMVKLIRASTDLPCAVGFGISTPEQAKKMAALSDGAIVGSADPLAHQLYNNLSIRYCRLYPVMKQL